MSRQNEEKNREKVEPEALKAELDKAALEAFGGEDMTVPPAPAKEFAMKPAGGQWVVYEAESVKPKDEQTGPAHPAVSSTPSSVVLGGDFNKNGDTPQTRTEIPVLPASGTSSEAGTLLESSAGGESLPPSSSSPPAPWPLACSTCGIAMPCDPYEHECPPIVQPTPEQVALVASKASGVLSKRTAEGRASKWSKATTRKARKPALCDVCQPHDTDRPCEWEPLIKAGDKHRDKNGARCCWTCWERLESEAAGAGKAESAA